MALQHSRHLLHDLKVKTKKSIQPRPLHLEHHLPTAAQTGAVHLSQRGSTKGLRVEVNDLCTALTKLFFEHGLHLIKTECRNAVLQSRQFGHPARRENIWPGGQQLPKLDEG
jgi:hypothetical protein